MSEVICTGFVVKANVADSVDAKPKEKVISRKFESRQAADDYAALAKRYHPDAWVHAVERMSQDGFTATKTKK